MVRILSQENTRTGVGTGAYVCGHSKDQWDINETLTLLEIVK